MDRNARSNKPKASHHGSELFALGSKSSRSDEPSKSKSGLGAKAGSSSDRKRDSNVSLPGIGGSKKPKLASHPGSKELLFAAAGSSSIHNSESQEYWEQTIVDCDPNELVTAVLTAMDQQDSDKLIGLVCGAIKMLIATRNKLDNILTLSLTYLAKMKPNIFCNDIVTSAILAIFKKEYQPTFKGRPSNLGCYVLATNLLMAGYRDKPNWPEKFVRLYIDDATNDRIWVDNEDCSPFVENVCTAFETRVPPKHLLQPDNLNIPSMAMTSKDIAMDEESSESHSSDTLKLMDYGNVVRENQLPRYTHKQAEIEKLVLDAAKEHLNRRQAPDCSTRNFLKFLSATSGICDVRAMAIARLELWIHNGKLLKPAQELLTYICCNIKGIETKDHEVLSNLVKMRLKTKQLIYVYMNSIKEMIHTQPNILFILLKFVVQNELSNARNPNNMGMLTNMFQTTPDISAEYLAEIYKEFLMQREDCIRTLRVFLRELAKILRYDINLVQFCTALTRMSKEYVAQVQSFEFRDRLLNSVVDLVCLSMFLSVSPQVREANNQLRTSGDLKISPTLKIFYNNMADIQLTTLTWMQTTVATDFKPVPSEYAQMLHKLLFLDVPESYTKSDQWPPDPERALLLRLVSEIPVHEKAILCIIYIGVTKEIPFIVPDTMEIIEQVVRRAAGFRFIDYSTLHVSNVDVIEYLFHMAEYRYPEKIALPVGYEPPKLAISKLYWKVWSILLMLSAHNPTTVGSFCWQQYPMLRNLMEFCITNQFQENKAISEEEIELGMLERRQILEFETHLAAATSKVVITEQNSLLLSQLMLMDPMGVARKPPPIVVDQLKTMNKSHRLGHLLCRSRKPDLLLEIIHKYGTSQAMPWLADLVQNSDGDFSHLPVQCLCEFLLSHSNAIDKENVRDLELINYLQNILKDVREDNQTAMEVIEYFLQRLSSQSKQGRQLSINGLNILLKIFRTPEDGDEEAPSDWLLLQLPRIPQFPYFRSVVIVQLRAACQIENDHELISHYIQFIATHTQNDTVPEMVEHVMDMSLLIVERSVVFARIIPQKCATAEEESTKLKTLNCLFVMFNNYFIKLREQEPPYNWNEYNDLLIIRFYDHSELHIHMNIFHGFVILMTHSNLLQNAQQIINFWFPMSPGSSQIILPQGLNYETREPVNIFPDWLKLKMIRSPVDRLLDASLQELTSSQIVLFLQSFGTPIPSMSKLLALLDIAVIEQFEAVKASIINKRYLVELIEIQHQRGAKNGHIALKNLLKDENKKMEEDAVVAELSFVMQNVTLEVAGPTSSSRASTRDTATKPNHMEELIESVFQNRSTKSQLPKLLGDMITNGIQRRNLDMFIMTFLQPSKELVATWNGVTKESARMLTVVRFLLQLDPEKMNVQSKLLVIDNLLKDLPHAKCTNLVYMLMQQKTILQKKPVTRTTKRKLSARNYEEFATYLQTAPLNEMETKGKAMMNELMTMQRQQQDNSTDGGIVKAIVTALNSNIQVKGESRMEVDCDLELRRNPNDHKKGLLVDWLAEIDSELVSNYHTLEMDLLFTNTDYQFRFYLLSLLIHQTHWQTLKFTVDELLVRFIDTYDPTSVLDFIESILNNPKLWQGRDKMVSIMKYSEVLLTDQPSHYFTMAQYIIYEQTVQNADDDLKRFSMRVDLLLQCMGTNYEPYTKQLIKYMVRSEQGGVSVVGTSKIRCQFLQLLYNKMPFTKLEMLSQGFDLEAAAQFDGQAIMKMQNCALDKTAHYLMTSLICCSSVKDWQMLSHDVEVLLIKMASAHPYLFLRHLTVLPALMQGRISGDFAGVVNMSAYRNDFQLQLFNTVLNVLEVLRPQIFESTYTEPLHDTLITYLNLFYMKDSKGLLARFVDYLREYCRVNQKDSRRFLQAHYSDMTAFANQYNLQVLHQFLQQFSYSMIDVTAAVGGEGGHNNNNDDGANPDKLSLQLILKDASLMPNPLSAVINQDYRLINALREATDDDKIYQLLEEWESGLQRQPLASDTCLYFEKIVQLLGSYSERNRFFGHTMLLRQLKLNCGKRALVNSAFLAYSQCLESGDQQVVASALGVLSEAIVYLQEHACELLKSVFELGIASPTNTFTCLKKCFAVLNLQRAC